MTSLNELIQQLGEDEKQLLREGRLPDSTARFLINEVDEADLADLDILLGEPAVQPSPLSPAEQQLQAGIVGGVSTAPSEFEQAATTAMVEGQEGLKVAIPTAASVAGGALGAAGGAILGQPIAGGFVGSVAGEVAGQEALQALGLEKEQPLSSTTAEALGLEVAGGVGSFVAKSIGNRIGRFIPEPVKETLGRMTGMSTDEFITKEAMRERIVGEGEELVGESLERLGLSEEAKRGLTITQQTEGVAGIPVAAELAARESTARSRGAKSAFGKADEQLRKELEDIITERSRRPRIKGENFSSSFNRIINSEQNILKNSLKARGDMEKSLVNNPQQTVDFGNGFKDAVDAFKLEVTSFDPSEKDKIFSSIKAVLPDDTTNMTLRDVDNLMARISNLSTQFSENKAVQSEVSGILGRFRKNIIEPILLTQADIKNDVRLYVENATAIRTLKEKQSTLNTAKTVIAQGVTEIARGKKAKGGKQLLSTVFSSPESYRQFKDILEEAQEFELLTEVNEAFVSDILNKSIANASELGKTGAKNLSAKALNQLIEDQNTAALIRTIKGDQYFENLQRVQNVLAARESTPLLINSLEKTSAGEMQKTMAELAGRFGLAKVTKHSLRAASSLLALMDKTVQNVIGLRGQDEKKLLEYISSPENVAKFDVLLNTKITDPAAYGAFSSALRNATGKFIARDEFNALVGLAEEGAFDKVPVEGEQNETNQ